MKKMAVADIVLLLIIGFLGGTISGSLGVGGGVIIIPALVFIMGMTQHEAIGTNLAVLTFPIGIMGVINFKKNGYVNIKFALIIIAAFLIGSYVGSAVAVHLPDKILKKIFSILLLFAAVRMFFSK